MENQASKCFMCGRTKEDLIEFFLPGLHNQKEEAREAVPLPEPDATPDTVLALAEACLKLAPGLIDLTIEEFRDNITKLRSQYQGLDTLSELVAYLESQTPVNDSATVENHPPPPAVPSRQTGALKTQSRALSIKNQCYGIIQKRSDAIRAQKYYHEKLETIESRYGDSTLETREWFTPIRLNSSGFDETVTVCRICHSLINTTASNIVSDALRGY